MARAFITPRSAPTANDECVLLIPNQPEYRAVLRGFLLDLTKPEAWEQIETNLTPAQAASYAEVILDSFEDNNQCP